MLSLLSRFRSILIFLFVAFAGDIYSQTLPSTTSFRKPEIIVSSEDLQKLSAGAIDQVVQTDSFFLTPRSLPSALHETLNFMSLTFTDISWPYGDLLAEMAQFDLFTSQTKYKDIVRKSYLRALQDVKPHHEFQLVYGYAASLAYRAYGDETFLKIAERIWNSGLSLTLTDSDIAAGRFEARNFAIASVCPNGATLVGGTLAYSDVENYSALNVAATGDFLILSVALWSATSNQTYLELAQKSADFVQRHMYSGNGLFVSDIRSEDCSPVDRDSHYPYSSGAIIYGLSLLSTLTQDTSTMAFVQGVVGSTTSNGAWHQPGLILSMKDVHLSDFGEPKVHLMRGYTELYRANTTPTDFKSYLGSYISTQFNAVVDLATSGGSNIYSSQYDGPAEVQFNNDWQAGAVAALLGGLAVGGNNASTAPPGDPYAGSEPRSQSSPVGAIVGGAIGGIILAGIIAASLGAYRRRVRAQAQDHEIVTPYEAPTPPNFNIALRSTGKHQPPPPSGTATVLDSTEASSNGGITSTLGLLEELVGALNRRMGNERRWDSNEPPPDYSTRVDHSPLERGKRAG
ncbi:hypothetical protein PM082_014155 [Marasmius tenuissimus]|nr:hypothetical protein PM082_014155 [Marasmius tenuissimus]